MAAAKTKNKTRTKAKTLPFYKRLVLNQYMFSLFNIESFEKLSEGMKDQALEGFDENNISRFYHHLTNRFYDLPKLTKDQLLQYDQNIVRHTAVIKGKRENPITWKYFQYLSLLFTEIYLDRYFNNPDNLLAELNAFLETFNADKSTGDKVEPYEFKDLSKLAFWNATGSGKTLLMHVNILQYLHYLKKSRREKELNRIILLTPNEGLSIQHKKEFDLSGMMADFFTKESAEGSLYAGQQVEIIDIHKLKDESGEKTVSVDAFEGNNLVLVDEGHRGSSGVDWKEKRDKLCEHGFTFEYSATFGQAVKSKKKLIQEYAKCILFDYSYKYFYKDGYGKDYKILNLQDDSDDVVRKRYLTACLVSYYQQLKIYQDKKKDFEKFLLEKPLLVFVGSRVNAVRTESKNKVSDVVEILLFFDDFLKKETNSVEILKQLISGKTGLLDAKKRDIFAGSFTYLIEQRYDANQLYKDIIKTVFNCEITGAQLHLDNLKQVGGEIGLRVGDNKYFGVINVGDEKELLKLCEKKGLLIADKDFASSLFQHINNKNSTVNILIGSKKFSEGWNSWRVSTMGLMNIGKNEGSEIIQLFGRGVRLKGYNFSLKRSSAVLGSAAPQFIDKVETLNVFGVKANYMRQFQEYLEEEGLPSEDNWEDFTLPTIKLPYNKKLKIIKLKDGVNFKKKGPNPTLDMPNDYLTKNPVIVDWYPKIQAIQSGRGNDNLETSNLNVGKLATKHLALINMEDVYLEIIRYKNESGWYNLNITKNSLEELLKRDNWYILYIPKEELDFTSFEKVHRWQEVAVALLKKYCDRYYKYKKAEYESDKMEITYLYDYQKKLEREGKPGNLVDEYYFRIQQNRDDIIAALKNLKKQIKSGKLNDFTFANIEAVAFDRHLYKPLIHLTGDVVKVTPVALNQGERDFVVDLRSYYQKNIKYFEGKELYLLRNQGPGRGIGFFEANNFYPDFILWIVKGDIQYITFVDPKGIRNCDGIKDPKISFYKSVKEMEERMGDPNVVFNSFIISRTDLRQINWRGDLTEKDFENYNVLFSKTETLEHIDKMMRKILKDDM